MRTLHLLRTAYRATIEEQDDPVLWLLRSLAANGQLLDIVLCGAAVSYLAANQSSATFAIADRPLARPPDVRDDLASAVADGIGVFYVAEDARRRFLAPAQLLPGATPVALAELGDMLRRYRRVHAW